MCQSLFSLHSTLSSLWGSQELKHCLIRTSVYLICGLVGEYWNMRVGRNGNRCLIFSLQMGKGAEEVREQKSLSPLVTEQEIMPQASASKSGAVSSISECLSEPI